MKPALFLRIASVSVIVQSVLHTIGGVFGKPGPGAASAAVAAMKANHFPVTGLDRTYWDFFIGFGLVITVFLVVEGVVFWLLGSLAAKGVEVRPILAAFFVGYMSLAALAYVFFFAGPLICDAVVAALLGIAIFAARPARLRAAVSATA
jgi:hypothetical protein